MALEQLLSLTCPGTQFIRRRFLSTKSVKLNIQDSIRYVFVVIAETHNHSFRYWSSPIIPGKKKDSFFRRFVFKNECPSASRAFY